MLGYSLQYKLETKIIFEIQECDMSFLLMTYRLQENSFKLDYLHTFHI